MTLTTLDLAVFLGSLVLVMGAGLWAGRSEETADDYFLAGRNVRWWGVAASIFGTNSSANHLVGMLGIGFSIGFAQSHFELGAVVALMVLCYGFLAVYRKLQLFTLSDYLGQRYDARSQALYAVLMIVLVLVQLTAAFYIGSRSMLLLFSGTPLEVSYEAGIILIALVTAGYTIVGGLKAVVFTDVIQSVLLLAAGVTVALFTFAQPEVGGWSGMMAKDAARAASEQKMHLYLPSDHPDLPWSGALTGLMILHLFYWSTNQYVVQRALAAASLSEARTGIITAGFLKLLVPFFAIGGGVAASFLFQARLPDTVIDPDAAMPELIRLVIPVGYGLVGLITAGLLGAILSSIDSMVNSASTLVTFDVYRKWIRPDASDRELLGLGRWVIAILIGVSAALAVLTYDAESKGNFFLRVSSMSGHFTPGLFVVFALGMLWPRTTATASTAAIVVSPVISFLLEPVYRWCADFSPLLTQLMGAELNFLHRVFATALFALVLAVLVSRRGETTERQRSLTIAAMTEVPANLVRRTGLVVTCAVMALLGLGVTVDQGLVSPRIAAVVAAMAALAVAVPWIRRDVDHQAGGLASQVIKSDRLWASFLGASTLFLMFEFF